MFKKGTLYLSVWACTGQAEKDGEPLVGIVFPRDDYDEDKPAEEQPDAIDVALMSLNVAKAFRVAFDYVLEQTILDTWKDEERDEDDPPLA